MSDSMLTDPNVAAPINEQSPLAGAIMAAPEPVWKKLKGVLGVGTREEAAVLVESDENAASAAASILNGEEPQEPAPTAMTPPSSPADTLYGKTRKASVRF
jgi:hypothetical protein